MIQEQVLIRPERYAGYQKDLIGILHGALLSVAEGASTTKRRKDLADAIKAKASRLNEPGDAS